ncbi:uncharacterized protein LOC111088560 [Limulus polyphemus]|uniref:Uncharacterized protein LOC111088560 n=1 Tax=Limulus polyphemus TaxID=6850 RepID=A0ABM1TFV2_LIMPO|nr:uncharacterized protein LOC111088560 [Limulus polyphemus]
MCTPINLACSSLLNCDNSFKDILSDINQTRKQSQDLQNQILTQQHCSSSPLSLARSSNLIEPLYSVSNNFKTSPENLTSECCTGNVEVPSFETRPISPNSSFCGYQLLRNLCNGSSYQPSSSEPSGDDYYILSDTVEMDTKFPLTSQSIIVPVLSSSLNSVPIPLNDYNVLQPYKPHTSITSSRLSLGTFSALERGTLTEKYVNVSDTTPTLTSTVTGEKSINPTSTNIYSPANESHVLWEKMPSDFPFNSLTCKIPQSDAPESSDYSDILPIPEQYVTSFSPFPNEVNCMEKTLFAQQSTMLSKSDSYPFQCLPISVSNNHSNLSKPSAIVNPIILPLHQQPQPLLPLNSLHQQVMTRSEPVTSVHTPRQQFVTRSQQVPPLNIPYLQVITQPKPLISLNTSHQQTKTGPQSCINTIRQQITTCSQTTSSVDTLVDQKVKPQPQPLFSVNSLQQQAMVQPHVVPTLNLHQQPIMLVPEKPHQPLPEVLASTETLELSNNKEGKSTVTFAHSSQQNLRHIRDLSRRDDSRRFHCSQLSTQEVLPIESFLDSEKPLSPQLSSTTDFSKFGISLTIDKNKTHAVN